jgi:DNA-binding protein YbaB
VGHIVDLPFGERRDPDVSNLLPRVHAVEHNGSVTFQSGNPEIDRQMGKIFEQLGQFQALQQELIEARETAATANGLVEVTVGPSGNLLRVDLNPRAMRLESFRLNEAIMAAYRDACAQMSRRVNELMRPLLPEGVRGGDDLVSGTLKVVGPDGTPRNPMRAVQEAFEHRTGSTGRAGS